METIVLFDPSIRSHNMGDHIIMKSAEKMLENITEDKFIIKSGTHSPVATFYQNNSLNPQIKLYDSAKYKFICGSNLLWKNMMVVRPSLNINLWNCRMYRNSILLGVGTKDNKNKPNIYTKKLYSKILSKKYIHSVRDEETKRFLEELGYKAINTGCPTMWKFTKEFCEQIPTHKADDVVFTLTDYGKDAKNDQELINILLKLYKNVYFWVQGTGDKDYLETLNNTESIKIIPPTLSAYEKILNKKSIDFVGTRLHAGMFALQHKKRTIILEIDNRVRDMKETYNLNTLKREDIYKLEDMIRSDFETKISIKEENISRWLSQFK